MATAPRIVDTERLLEEDGFVRGLARSLLRDADAAEDLAQQTWVAALERPRHPGVAVRNWLVAVMRRLAIKRERGAVREGARIERTRIEHTGRASDVPSPATIVAREAMRAELVRAVLELEAPYRDVVLLRYFESLPPRAVAARLRLPVETVRTRLKRAMAQLRARLDARTDGGRSAWCALLLPFAKAPAGAILATAASVGAALTGALFMTTKATVALTLAALAALILIVTLWTFNKPAASPDDATPPIASARENATHRDSRVESAAAPTPTRSEAAESKRVETSPADAKTGSLLVHVVWSDTKNPAAGVVVQISRGDNDLLVASPHGTSDAEGIVKFPALEPGRIWVVVRRGESDWGPERKIVRNQLSEATVEVAPGMNAKGVVTDSRGKPIAGADVMVTGWTGGESVPLTQTAFDGTFALRALSTHCHIGAAAAGYGPSPMREFTTAKGAEVEFQIVLPDAGAALTGVVLGPGGKPVAGAVVRAGSREQKQQILADGGRAMGPQPQCAATDSEGRFSFASVEAGPLPLAVRARGLAPATQTIDLATVRQRDVTVELLEGVVLVGSVRDASGGAVASVEVAVGDWDDIGHTRVRTDASGAFRAEGLAAGELAVHVDSEKSGKAKTKLRALAGETVRWDAVLSQGAELRGRVEDFEGKPVANAIVEVNVGWFGYGNTDDQGRFALKNCPLGKPMEVNVRRKSTFPEARVSVTPTGNDDLVIRLPREAWVFIQGKILDPDGKPLPNVHASPFMKNGGGSPAETVDAATGEFKYGPYPPGEYSLRFQADGYPELHLSRTLGPDETWDTGTLHFARGGTLAATLVDKGGLANPNVSLTVLAAGDEQVDALRAKDGIARSKPLNPGKYSLQIVGEGVASALIPFEIQDAVETRLDVPVIAGVAVAIEIAVPTGDKVGDGIHVAIEPLGGAAVLRLTTWPRSGSARVSCALVAGEYKVSVKAGALRGESQLSVGSAGAVVAKVALE